MLGGIVVVGDNECSSITIGGIEFRHNNITDYILQTRQLILDNSINIKSTYQELYWFLLYLPGIEFCSCLLFENLLRIIVVEEITPSLERELDKLEYIRDKIVDFDKLQIFARSLDEYPFGSDQNYLKLLGINEKLKLHKIAYPDEMIRGELSEDGLKQWIQILLNEEKQFAEILKKIENILFVKLEEINKI